MHTSERLDGFVRLILVVLMGLIPFIAMPIPWIVLGRAKILIVASILLVAGVLWLVARFTEGGVKIPWASSLFAAILVPLAYAISSALTGFEGVSLVGTGAEIDTLAFVCVGFALFALSASVFSMHPGKVVSAMRALLVGGLVLLVVEIVHFVFPSLSIGGLLAGQTGNLLGNWHEFSMFAGLAGFLSLAMLGTAVTASWWRYVAWTCAILAGAFLLLASFFDVLFAIMCALLVLSAVHMYRAKVAARERWWDGNVTLLSGALVTLFILVFGSFVVNVLPAQIRVVQTDVRPSFAGTFAIGQQSLARPLALLVGAGPNTFNREWGLHKSLDVNQTDFWNVDFSVGAAPIATSFITVGLLGLFAWIAFMLAMTALVVRLWFSSTETAAISIALPLSVATLYLFALYAVSSPGTTIVILMFFLAGLLVALSVPAFVRMRTFSMAKGGAVHHVFFSTAVLSGIALIFASGALVRIGTAEAIVNKGIFVYNESKNIESASNHMKFALRVHAGSDRAHTSAVQLGLLSLQELNASKNPDDEATKAKLKVTLEETIKHGLAAVEIDGGNYQNWLVLASLYAQLAGSNVEGAYDSARAAFERALAENPTFPVPYVNLAQLEILQKNPDRALALLTRAVELKANFAVAYYLASQIYAGKADYENAFQAATGAVQYAREDAQAWYNLGVISYAAKRYPEAVAALQQALVIQPQFANAEFLLGLSRYRAGNKADALESFKRLQEIDPSQKVAAQLIADITAGRELTEAQLNGQMREEPAKPTR